MLKSYNLKELTEIVGFKHDNHFPKVKKKHGGRLFKNILRLQNPTYQNTLYLVANDGVKTKTEACTDGQLSRTCLRGGSI